MTMNLETRCPLCGAVSVVVVNAEDFEAWQNGELVQNAFPYLDANEREALVSGICPDCWDRMFPSSDDDEDWEDEWPDEDDSPEWHDECDMEEEEDFPDDYWLEVDFNPYMGCYDYDC